jgi:hypothetical protein
MKLKLLICALGLSTMAANAQSVPRAFEDWKTAAGTQNFFYKNVTKTDAFGNVVVAGATMSNGVPDILVAKYNPHGVQLWIQQFSGLATNGIDFAAGLYVTDTYVYLTGAVTNNTTTPETDCFTMKLSTSTGSIVWNTTYSGSAGYIDGGKFVTVDGSGDVYVTGTTYNSSGNADYLTLKYNGTTGTQTWVNTWGYSAGLDDAAIKCQFSGTNLVVTGAVTSATNNYKVATLTMPQSTGVISATNVAAAVTTSSVDAVVDLTTDGAGNIIIIGSQYVSGQGNNFYCQKVAGGTLVSAWTYTWNGSSNLDDFGKAVAVDASNNVFIAGSSQSSTLGKELTLIKLNSSGVVQSTATSGFAGDDEAVDMVIDASNNVYLTGYKTNATYHDKNYYTVKYSNACAKTWEIETDGTSYDDNGTNLTLDSLNNVIVTGQSATSSTGDFRFLTTKYVQMDVTNPVDLLAQPTNPNFGYHTNKGQILDETGASAPNALYYTHHQNPEIYIEKNSYNYVFAAIDTVMATNDSLEKIHVSFAGSSSTVKPYAYDAKTYPLNYFLGHLSQPVTNVVGNDRMVTKDLYPNIDLHYFSNASGLKYYFVVNPGGSVKDIALNIAGANSTTITSNKLVIDGVIGDVTLKRPYAYMVNGAVTTTLTGNSSWNNAGSNTYGITVPSYTTTQTLVIVIETNLVASPVGTTANCDYSSYYGGNTVDKFSDVKTSATGGRVVTGYSYGGTFPTINAFQSNASSSGAIEAIILKYSAGDTLKWATYYGGNGADFGNSIALTSIGDIIIGGETQSLDLPVTTGVGTGQPSNGYNTTNNLKSDGYLFKLNSAGNNSPFGRYVGGNKSDKINAIFIDGSDNLYFGGTTSSPNFPCVNANRGTMNSSTNADPWDCMLGKFSAGLTANWITYFGGTVNGNNPTATLDFITDILTDNSGNVFVSGYSDETDFPASNPSPGNANVLFDNSNNGGTDGFIARFTSGGVPNYATLIGGNAGDYVYRLAYNSNTQNLHFAGTVGSATGFPYKTKSGAYNSSVKRGSSVAFLGYINSSLEHQWITNYGRGGSTKYTGCAGLSVDNTGVVYLSGGTNSDTLVYGATVPTGAYVDNTASGGSDGYIAIFDNNKQIKHAHYWGGAATEQINNSDLYADSRLYVVGNTASNNMPIAYTSATAALIDSTFNGSDDAFISRFILYSYNGVGVKETVKNAENSVVLFPNPANNFVTLKILSELEGNVSVKVYNTIGQIIHEETISTNEKTIDCNSWSTGMYIFVVSNKTINSSFKIIKE